jgi:hypothetical protein
MTVVPFTLAVGPSTGLRPVQQVTDFVSWTLDNNLDDGCSLTFSTRGDSAAAQQIDELVTDLWLYDGGVLYQRFRTVSVSQEWGPDGEDEASVAGACYRRLLKKSHVRNALEYVGVAQDQIIVNLVTHAQAATGGNLGITVGSLTSSTPRYREYLVGQNIFDSIVEFTSIDGGVEWDVNSDLELNVRPQQSLPLNPTPVQLGVTARRMSRPSSAEQFGNAAIVTGNAENVYPQIVEDPNLATDPRGRWERYADLQADTDAELIELADGLIQAAISPVSTWTIEMEPDRYFGDAKYQIGELVTIVQPRSTVYPIGVAAPTIRGQVISRSITQTAAGEVTVIITAIEAPAP